MFYQTPPILIFWISFLLPGQLGLAQDETLSPPAYPLMAFHEMGRLSIRDLEARKNSIDEMLESLSPISLRGGIGSVGIRSKLGARQDRIEWFQVELSQTTCVDQVVLVPALWRDAKTGLRADGFPLSFRVIVGCADDDKGQEIAKFSEESGLLPRIAPLVIPCSSVEGSWVRIEVDKLSQRSWDGQYFFQLSEIMVFSGRDNVALRNPVRASSKGSNESRYLVDGFVPYLMGSMLGDPSIAFIEQGPKSVTPLFTIDLGVSYPLNRIHLHGVDLSDTVPRSIFPDGFGMPRRMLIEGANQPDFSDSVELIDIQLDSVNDFGPVIMRTFPEKPVRYVRLTATEVDTFMLSQVEQLRIGFAEIELFSKGENVALNSPVEINLVTSD